MCWFVSNRKTSPRSKWLTGKHLPSAQVVSPKNGGKHLDPMKLGKVKQPNSVSRICSSRVRCGFETAGDEVRFSQKSKQGPLLSTTTTVGGCSILNRVPARTRPLNTFRTGVSKSSKASFSTMKRQNMNKRAGSLETTLLKRIMLLPTAIKNIRSSSDHGHWERHNGYCYPHTYLQYNPIFVNKTLDKVRRLVYAGRLGVV